MAEGVLKTDDSQVESEAVNRMGSGSIPRLVAEFAIPSIAGMLVNGAYNLISGIFLGQAMGAIGLSVVTVATPIMIVFMALSAFVGAGGNALAALRLGQGNHAAAEKSLGNTFTLAVVIWLIVAAIAMCPVTLDGLLSLSSATPQVYDMSASFIRIISAGYIFQIVGMGINNFIRTCGAPNRALLTMVIGAVSCTVFNFFFVLQFGWGVEGCALATICGQALSCITVVWYFTRTPNTPLRLKLRNMKPASRTVKTILSLGAASLAVQGGAAVVNFVLNYLLVIYGASNPLGADNALASIGVVQRVAMFSVLPLIGISIAIQPLIGFNYGAHKYNRVRTTFVVGVLSGIVIGTLIWLVCELNPHSIVEAFGISNSSLADFTAGALKVQMAMVPLVAFQIIGSNYFQATGQPSKSIILSLSRQVIFLVPLYFALPIFLPHLVPFLTSLDALYYAVPVADCAAIVITACFVIWEHRRLGKLERGEITSKF